MGDISVSTTAFAPPAKVESVAGGKPLRSICSRRVTLARAIFERTGCHPRTDGPQRAANNSNRSLSSMPIS